MATGFTHVREILEGFEGDDVGAMLTQVGVSFGRKAPSTIGALLSSAFIRVGAELEGVFSLGSSDVAAMLQAATEAVAERGKVTTGMRTILDAMDAGAVAAAKAAARGVDPTVVFREAADGARTGAEATAAMEPRVGRAGWIKDRARGTQDAGAVAWAMFLDALAEAVARSDQLVSATLHDPTHDA
jgi:dihydroxyacetone kinase